MDLLELKAMERKKTLKQVGFICAMWENFLQRYSENSPGTYLLLGRIVILYTNKCLQKQGISCDCNNYQIFQFLSTVPYC